MERVEGKLTIYEKRPFEEEEDEDAVCCAIPRALKITQADFRT
jgi:hypothetical protein